MNKKQFILTMIMAAICALSIFINGCAYTTPPPPTQWLTADEVCQQYPDLCAGARSLQ